MGNHRCEPGPDTPLDPSVSNASEELESEDPESEVLGSEVPGSEGPADAEIFRELVIKHSDRLQRFIMKHIGNATEAEELAQQAFVEAAASYKAFRGESQLSSWLYGIALNLVRNYLSRAPERKHEFVSDVVLDLQSSPELSPQDRLEQNQTMAILEESISELPANMREILLLVGFEEISYEEAATLLTVPVGTIRSRLSRARTALREKMRQKGLSL